MLTLYWRNQFQPASSAPYRLMWLLICETVKALIYRGNHFRWQELYLLTGSDKLYSSFSQLVNSAISVKGKGLTNVKMYAERNVFGKGKIFFEATNSGGSRISPRRGCQLPGGGRQHMILPKFLQNCMKLKEFRPRGASLTPLFRSAIDQLPSISSAAGLALIFLLTHYF